MKIQVPKEVDVKGLVAALKLSKTQTINLKNKTYYFLSCIVSDNDNLNTDNYGYRNICSVLMKKLIGDKEYYKILKLLTSVKDPIIESDNSYPNPKIKGKGKGYCKGYTLTEKYNSGELAYKTLPVKFDKKIKRYGTDNNEGVTINEKYQFLFNQFENNQIGLDPLVYDYINSFVAALILMIKDKNIYQIKLVYNYIGRCLYYLSKFENSELWKNVSANNHRFNSSITSLPKILRPFINCNNKEMVMLDISSSQPYLLSSIINNNFFKDTNDGYNLKTIYNELYLELIVKGYININNSSNNININYSSNSSNNNTI